MKKLIPVIVLFLAVSVFAQEKPNAVLVDEFERLPCNDFKGRLDNFYNGFSAEPNSKGYIVLFAETGAMRTNVFYEGMIKGYFTRRKLDLDRLMFVRSSFLPKLTIQLWSVPEGTTPPAFPISEWSYKMAKNENAYKFTWQNDYDDMCPDVDGVKLYADFLKANPMVNGNIVIRDRTSKAIRKKEGSVIKELTGKYRISRNQLRLFRVIGTPDGVQQAVEYWLAP